MSHMSRLTHCAVVSVLTFVVAVGLGVTLGRRHRDTAILIAERLAQHEREVEEKERLVKGKFEELRRQDRELVSRRVPGERPCNSPLARPALVRILTEEMSRAPDEEEVTRMLEKAAEYRVCDVAQVRRLYRDPAATAHVETLYRLLLRRPADPYGRFVYGLWWNSGIPLEAAARDIMASAEFQQVRVEPRDFWH